jgi:hypothetical protein
MSQTAIFGPVFATVLLTFLVWVYMYVLRIRFITRSGMSPKELAVPGALARVSPRKFRTHPTTSRICSNFRSSSTRWRCISSPRSKSTACTWVRPGPSPDRLLSKRRAKRERRPFHALDRARSWLSEAP